MFSKLTWIYWRMLVKSKVFRYWYKRFLSGLMLDFEIFDADPDFIREKYKNKLKGADVYK